MKNHHFQINDDAMSTQVVIMTICDGMALLITVQNDDDYEARCQGSLVTPICHVINEGLQRHFFSIFSNLLMTPPLAGNIAPTSRLIFFQFEFQKFNFRVTGRPCTIGQAHVFLFKLFFKVFVFQSFLQNLLLFRSSRNFELKWLSHPSTVASTR